MDILIHETLPSNAKLWVSIMSKEINDEILIEFSDECLKDSFLENRKFPDYLPSQWRNSIKIELSKAQEKAMGSSLRLILFGRQNNGYNDEASRAEEADRQLNILKLLV